MKEASAWQDGNHVHIKSTLCKYIFHVNKSGCRFHPLTLSNIHLHILKIIVGLLRNSDLKQLNICSQYKNLSNTKACDEPFLKKILMGLIKQNYSIFSRQKAGMKMKTIFHV